MACCSDTQSRLVRLQDDLRILVDFLMEVEDLMQSHMNDYFTKNHQDMYTKLFDTFDSEENFIEKCGEISRLGCCYGSVEGHCVYCFEADPITKEIIDSKCMTEKKLYELTRFSPKVSEMADHLQCNRLVDIGSGKGYLGQHLSKESGCKVIGIEKSYGCSQSADDRATKLSNDGLYKTICHELDTKTFQERKDLMNKLKELFLTMGEERACNAIMVGLHCCGDLTSLAIKLFVAEDFFCSLNLIGCCYNLIESAFPMSKYSASKQIRLDKNMLMLACQCATKWKTNKQVLGNSLLYRAILEKIIMDKGVDRNLMAAVRFRRLGKKSRSFEEYMNRVLKQFEQETFNVTASEIDEYFNRYEKYWEQMKRYHWLRMQLAPCIEKLILLDRLCYLLESGVDAWIIRMFSPVVSPRCYSLVAHKKIEK